MHIPDGFLDTKTLAATAAFSMAGAANALRRLRRDLAPRNIPLVGLAAAFIFVAQMLNFPIGGGTSGHLLGATLIAVLLGPHVAIMVMALILLVQALLFADGGVLAYGANLFNMGIIGTLTGYSCYRVIRKILRGNTGVLAGAAFGAWLSTVVASVCCAGELAWSGLLPWDVAFPAMTGIHMFIGVGEGVITALVVAAILATRPALIPVGSPAGDAPPKRDTGDILLYGSLLVLGLLLFVSPFASTWPDGFEKVASAFGFDSRALSQRLTLSPLAEYRIPGIGSLPFATAIAGLAGAGVVLLLSFVLGRALSKRSA